MIRLRKCLLVFIIMFGLFGCRTEYNNFLLKNSTIHDIVIEGYRTNTLSYVAADEILLNPSSELTVKRRDGEDFDSRTFFSVPYVDSVNIIFNSNKILSLTCFSDTEINCHPILRGDLRVAITNQDYNNAVPIEE